MPYTDNTPGAGGIANLLDATVGKETNTNTDSSQHTNNTTDNTTNTSGNTTNNSNTTGNTTNNNNTTGNTTNNSNTTGTNTNVSNTTGSNTNRSNTTGSNTNTTAGVQNTTGTTTNKGTVGTTGNILTSTDGGTTTFNHEKVNADTGALRDVYNKQSAGISTEMLNAIFQQGSKAAPNLVLAQSNALGSRGVGNSAVAQVLNQLNGDMTSKAADINRQMLSDSGTTAGKIADLTKSVDSSGGSTTHTLTNQVQNLLTTTDSTQIVNQIVNTLNNSSGTTNQSTDSSGTTNQTTNSAGTTNQNTTGGSTNNQNTTGGSTNNSNTTGGSTNNSNTTGGSTNNSNTTGGSTNNSNSNTHGTQTQDTAGKTGTRTTTAMNMDAAKEILKGAAAGIGIDSLFRLATGKGFTGNLQDFQAWLKAQGGGGAGGGAGGGGSTTPVGDGTTPGGGTHNDLPPGVTEDADGNLHLPNGGGKLISNGDGSYTDEEGTRVSKTGDPMPEDVETGGSVTISDGDNFGQQDVLDQDGNPIGDYGGGGYADGGAINFLPINKLIADPKLPKADGESGGNDGMDLSMLLSALGGGAKVPRTPGGGGGAKTPGTGGGSGGNGDGGSGDGITPGGGGGDHYTGGGDNYGGRGDGTTADGGYDSSLDPNVGNAEMNSTTMGFDTNNLLSMAGLLARGTPLGAALSLYGKYTKYSDILNKALAPGQLADAMAKNGFGDNVNTPLGDRENTTIGEDANPSGPQGTGEDTQGGSGLNGTGGLGDHDMQGSGQMGDGSYDYNSGDTSYEGGGESGNSGGSSGFDGGGGCVAIDSYLPDGTFAASIKVNDTMQLADQRTLAHGTGTVSYSEKKLQPGYRIATKSASLKCSSTAPIPTKDGKLVLAPDLKLGDIVAINFNGFAIWEPITDVKAIGDIYVQHITVGDKCFWAGEHSGAYILHHNMKDVGGGSSGGITLPSFEEFADGGAIDDGDGDNDANDPQDVMDDSTEMLAALGITKADGGHLVNGDTMKFMTSRMGIKKAVVPQAKMQKLADGGMVVGPGTGISDSVQAMGPNGQPIKLSHKEYILPADVTAKIGVHNLDALVDKLHVPAEMQRAITGG